MRDSKAELQTAVNSALTLLIASLPFPKDASPALGKAWFLVLESEGIAAYQVEAAMVDALKLEAFPPPVVFAKLCHKHARPLRLTGANCLPLNTGAKALPAASVETVRQQSHSRMGMEDVAAKMTSGPRDLEDREQAARVKQQIADARARKQA